MTPDVVIGAGHNGLVAACYLAREGRDVLVLEAQDRPGGGSRTEETVPGFRFDLHSRHFMDVATPLVKVILPAVRGEGTARGLPARAGHLLQALRRQPVGVVRDLLGPYDALLRRWLPSDLTRGPVAAFAAHAGMGPRASGGSLFAFWQAAYHLFGQWHAAGGAQGLIDALVRRLTQLGGTVRCSSPVARIETSGGQVRAVVLEGGERIPATTVVTAMDPRTALLDLLDPPLDGTTGAALAAARRGNVVQAVVHVATDRLPPYPDSRPGDWNGLQSYVDRLDDLNAAWSAAESGHLTANPPLYSFTTSAIDSTLAPPGHHTVYVACPAAPAQVKGGWPARREEFIDACLTTLESRAPRFRSSVRGVAAWTPDLMEKEGRWPGAHPMYLDISLNQLGPLRPTRALGDHRTPVKGLYISGAGTNPSGGVVGTPGRMAAYAVLADQ
ncbi:MAG: NAD(P)/FAD-dependent oxidoreductase [Actinobacteria bacterium]|nr:NAD(P)/FAD-dependent oxidoreductase [Actinomycetota bacterium]